MNRMSHRNAMPKLAAPPPPHIHARQPIRLTARVAVFTVNGGGATIRKSYNQSSFVHQVNVRNSSTVSDLLTLESPATLKHTWTLLRASPATGDLRLRRYSDSKTGRSRVRRAGAPLVSVIIFWVQHRSSTR